MGAWTRSAFLAALIAAWLVLNPTPASALAIMFDVGNNGVVDSVVTDNGLGDLDPDVGQLLFNGGFAGFFVNLTFGTSNSPGVQDQASLTLTQMSVASTTGGVLRLQISDDDYSIDPKGPNASLLGQIGGVVTGTGSIAASQYVSLSNTLFGLGGPTINHGPFTGAFADTQSVIFPYVAGTPFALTQNALITLSPGAFASFDIHSVVATPEPASLALFGTGLALAAGYARRRRAPKA